MMRGVDRADRDAGDPVGMEIGLGQRLVDAGLVGAERAAALQHQGDAFEGKTAFCEHVARLDPSIHIAHSFWLWPTGRADRALPRRCLPLGCFSSADDGKAPEKLLAPECQERNDGHHQTATEARLLDAPGRARS